MSRVPELRAALVQAAAQRAVPAPAAAPGDGVGAQRKGGAPTEGRARTSRRVRQRARRGLHRVRRVPLLALAGAGALLTAAVALAATGVIQFGAPVRPGPGERFTPTTGYGIPVSASVRLLAVTAPDPAGGLRWGLRYLRTTRGVDCVQAGRVLDGRLGVLGEDGAFAEDGRFHELPADVFEPLGCAPADGAGHAFVGIGVHGLPASGTLRLGCSGAVAQAHTPATSYERVLSSRRGGFCRLADERLVLYGLLGPRARAIVYSEGRGRVTVPVRGPLGAYLIVRAARGARQAFTVEPLAMLAIGGHDVEVRYAGGEVCRIGAVTDVRARHSCPPVGYRAPSASPLSAHALAVPVSVHVGALRHHATVGHPPARIRRVSLEVAFSAPRAVSSAASEYLVEVLHAGRRHGASCGVGLEPVSRDVRRGERVRVEVTLAPACSGRWEGRVLYLRPSAGGGGVLAVQLRALAHALQDLHDRHPGSGTVGSFSFSLP